MEEQSKRPFGCLQEKCQDTQPSFYPPAHFDSANCVLLGLKKSACHRDSEYNLMESSDTLLLSLLLPIGKKMSIWVIV